MTWQEDALTKRNGHVAAGLTEAPTCEEYIARIKMQANISRGRVFSIFIEKKVLTYSHLEAKEEE